MNFCDMSDVQWHAAGPVSYLWSPQYKTCLRLIHQDTVCVQLPHGTTYQDTLVQSWKIVYRATVDFGQTPSLLQILEHAFESLDSLWRSALQHQFFLGARGGYQQYLLIFQGLPPMVVSGSKKGYHVSFPKSKNIDVLRLALKNANIPLPHKSMWYTTTFLPPSAQDGQASVSHSLRSLLHHDPADHALLQDLAWWLTQCSEARGVVWKQSGVNTHFGPYCPIPVALQQPILHLRQRLKTHSMRGPALHFEPLSDMILDPPRSAHEKLLKTQNVLEWAQQQGYKAP